MKALLLGMSLALTALNAHAAGSQCTYTYSASAAKVSWTAYKTTAKIPVTGQLSGATLTTATTATNLVDQLNGTSMSVSLSTSNTGLPLRDTNLANTIFKVIVGGPVTGTISQATLTTGSTTSGTFNLNLNLNAVTRSVPMTFSIAGGVFSAKGTMQMPDFSLAAALAALDQTCATYHAGADKISVVAPGVDLAISVPVTAAASCQ